MKRDSNPKYHYSKIQYFFWLLSGAEIGILKNCPTDFNRQAGIGFTIFMTTVLAFCSGSYAGYYFGESIAGAVIFGCVWAALIFSIDRSMVVTLKKDPTKAKQNFLIPFLARAVLAILIAFIISIPLELLIFKENIDLHMQKYKTTQQIDFKDAVKNLTGIEEQKGHDKELAEAIEIKKTQLDAEPTTYEYRMNKESLVTTINNLSSKENELRNKQSIVNSRYNSVPTVYDEATEKHMKDKASSQWKVYLAAVGDKNNVQTEVKQLKAIQEELEAQKKELEHNWKETIGTEKEELEAQKKKVGEEIIISDGHIAAETNKLDSLYNDKNGFVLRFMVLEDQAELSNEQNKEGKTIFFLLWLIRILFFTIEILPTVAKLATPIGAYDRAIYHKEKDLELELQEKSNEYLHQQKTLRAMEYDTQIELKEKQLMVEKEMQQQLTKEIADAQMQVARKKIDEFKQNHLN